MEKQGKIRSGIIKMLTGTAILSSRTAILSSGIIKMSSRIIKTDTGIDKMKRGIIKMERGIDEMCKRLVEMKRGEGKVCGLFVFARRMKVETLFCLWHLGWGLLRHSQSLVPTAMTLLAEAKKVGTDSLTPRFGGGAPLVFCFTARYISTPQSP